MQIRGVDLVPTGKKFLQEFRDDELTVRAGNLAFRFFLALFPLMLFMAAMGGVIADIGNVEDPTGRVMDWLDDTLPADATSVVERQVDIVVGSSSPALLSLGMIGAIWAAASGTGALVAAINKTYDTTESRPFWKATLLSLGMTLAGGIVFIALVTGVVVSQVFAEDIAGWLGIRSQFNLFVSLVQFPLVLAVVLTAIAVLYWIAPTVDLPFKWISPGAVAFVVLWAPFTVGFAFYVANFASYNATYGTLGGIVILMLWFYYSSVLILAGSELNAVLTVERPGAEKSVTVAASGDEAPDGRQPDGHVATRTSFSDGHATSARNGHAFAPSATPLIGLAGLALAAFALRKIVR